MRFHSLVLLLCVLVVTEAHAQGDPCSPNPCTNPPADQCLSATELQHYDPVGTCVDVGGSPACSYSPTVVDCAASGGVCMDGQCVVTSPVPWLENWGAAIAGGLLIAAAAFTLRRRRHATPGA